MNENKKNLNVKSFVFVCHKEHSRNIPRQLGSAVGYIRVQLHESLSYTFPEGEDGTERWPILVVSGDFRVRLTRLR